MTLLWSGMRFQDEVQSVRGSKPVFAKSAFHSVVGCRPQTDA